MADHGDRRGRAKHGETGRRVDRRRRPAPESRRSASGRPRARSIVRFYRSAVGKKWVMAVTGVILMGFVLAHLIGNLKLYLSKEEINLYGEALRNMPGHLLPRTVLLWTIRIVLILAFVFHIHSAYGLTLINRKARPAATGTSRSATTSPPTSRRARCAGPASSCCCSSIFHLMDLTWGNANPQFVRGDPYNNLVYSLQRPAVAIVYVVANIALGVPPVPRRLVDVPEPGHQQPALQQAAPARSRRASRALILVGNLSFPIAVQLHAVDAEVPAHRTHDRGVQGRIGDAMTLDSKIPAGPARREVGQPQVRHQARQPGEQAPVRDHRRRHRPRRRVGGRDARRARLQA